MAAFEEDEFSYGVGNEKKLFYLAAGNKEGPLLIFIHGEFSSKACEGIVLTNHRMARDR